MAFWDWFKNEESESRTEIVDTSSATWKSCEQSAIMWQVEYAFLVVHNILATFLTNVDWKTYKSGEVIKGDEWFRFNIAPNRRDTSAEFYSKLAEKLIYEGRALIIETATKELFIADSYTFKNGQELLMKDNVFADVMVGSVQMNRTFKENDSCMYIRTPGYDRLDTVFSSMGLDFLELKNLIMEGAQKALGMKLSLTLNANSKNKYDKEYLQQMQKAYEPLMKARDAVFVNYKGETLADLTEKQRGSEVQQVLTAVENNIKVNEEILVNVGNAFGIPSKFMNGDFTADNNSIYEMAMTMFGKRYLTLLSKKFTYFVLSKDDIIKGSKVEANLNSVKFIDKLSMATAVDKFIGSGAYNRNEVREMLDDDPVDDGDIYFITKNYAELSQYVKGGSKEE